MTKAKSLLLGSAAALATVSGAQAADLGLPVAAVNYVQICSVGSFTGFLLPGSDVCLDISGFAQFQANFNGEDDDDADGTVTDNSDDYDFNAEIDVNFDARTMTEWGLLRGFVGIAGDGDSEDFSAIVDKAYVQIGGLTAGLTDSFFDPVYTDYVVAPAGAMTGDEDLLLVGYNMNVGNGLTFMASLESNEERNTGIGQLGNVTTTDGVFDIDLDGDGAADVTGASAATAAALGDLYGSTFTVVGAFTSTANEVVLTTDPTVTQGFTSTAYDESATMPDFVAALRVDQAWGAAKLSAALHELDAEDPDVDTAFGFAVGASAYFNLPVGYGSTFGIRGQYGQGAVEYTGFDNTISGETLPWLDAIVDGDDLELTESWGIGAGVDIGFSETLSWQLEGFYSAVDHYDATFLVGADTDADGDIDTISASNTADLDGSVFSVRTGLQWTPVSGLLIAGGVAYQQFDFDQILASNGTVSDFDGDDDQVSARLRIRRSF